VAGPDLTASQLQELLALRAAVFVVEQECIYLDVDGRDLENGTEHLWFEDGSGITAAVRIIDEPGGRRLGRVVTRSDSRGNGLASKLMVSALEHLGSTTTVLDAQSHLTNFYARLGYSNDGPEFIEDGIAHTPMIRRVERSSE